MADFPGAVLTFNAAAIVPVRKDVDAFRSTQRTAQSADVFSDRLAVKFDEVVGHYVAGTGE